MAGVVIAIGPLSDDKSFLFSIKTKQNQEYNVIKREIMKEKIH